MVSPEPSEKGLSKTRKWGVKDHIERPDRATPIAKSTETAPFDWPQIYMQEKASIEKLAQEPPQ
jgi:hypothetical protein